MKHEETHDINICMICSPNATNQLESSSRAFNGDRLPHQGAVVFARKLPSEHATLTGVDRPSRREAADSLSYNQTRHRLKGQIITTCCTNTHTYTHHPDWGGLGNPCSAAMPSESTTCRDAVYTATRLSTHPTKQQQAHCCAVGHVYCIQGPFHSTHARMSDQT